MRQAHAQVEVIHSLPTDYSLCLAGEQVVKKKFFIFSANYCIFILVP
jgi:hypothetical protein